jgi:4-diphosphocytidyl-2-C-methyl-D-erythritol kinase
MSGSGATCFAIFSSAPSRDAAARALAKANPSWWLATTTLPLPGWGIVTRAPDGGALS